LGGIYGGIFTPTEAAAVSALYGLIVGLFIYRTLSLKDIMPILRDSVSQTAVVMFIVGTASLFAWVLTVTGVAADASNLLIQVSAGNKYIFLLIVNIILLIAGCFLDNAVAVILLTPIFVNVVQAMNIDICYFGVFLVFVLAIGQVTPPVGLCLFVACDIGKVSIEKISREVLPYVGGLIVTAILLVLFPQIVTWLPSLTKMA